MSQPEPLLMLAFINRRPDLSEEQFYDHWQNVHAPKIALWCQRHGLVGYTQIRTPSSARQELLQTQIPATILNYDAAVIWEVPSLEHFTKAFSDPYYTNVIAVDEKNFLDTSGSRPMVTMGYSKQVVAGCKPLVDCSKDLKAFEESGGDVPAPAR